MAIIIKDNKPLAVVQYSDLDLWFEGNGIAKDDVEIQLTGRELADIRAATGQAIISAMHDAGVPQSALIGLLCDVAQYNAYANAVSIVALGDHGNAAQKAYIKGSKALPGAQAFMAALNGKESGLKIPVLEKGVESVLPELKAILDVYAQVKSDKS